MIEDPGLELVAETAPDGASKVHLRRSGRAISSVRLSIGGEAGSA